jgi:hypothetical protein
VAGSGRQTPKIFDPPASEQNGALQKNWLERLDMLHCTQT